MKRFLPLLILIPLYGQADYFKGLDSLLSSSILDSLVSKMLNVQNNFQQVDDNWKVNESVDEMTDERILRLTKVSNERQNFNYDSHTGLLNIISTDGKLDLYVDWQGFITNESATVTFRIGDDPAKKEKWYMSTNRKASFASNPVEMIRKMRNEKRALFRVTPYGDSPITYSFDISALDSLIKIYSEDFIALNESQKNESNKRVKFIPYDDPPQPLTEIRPVYPEIAQEAGIEGTVVVQVFVDKKGRVQEAVILKGIPNSGLDEAAIVAISKIRFKPAKQGKKPVGVWISIPVNFRLK